MLVFVSTCRLGIMIGSNSTCKRKMTVAAGVTLCDLPGYQVPLVLGKICSLHDKIVLNGVL